MASRGLNLPSQHADTNQGNFLPGVFSYKSYRMPQLRAAGFNAVRLGVNVDTANDPATLATLRAYTDEVEAFSENATTLVCMWDTLLPNQTAHGDGLVNSITEMAAAWKKVAAAFEGTKAHFEIFNEPFGYTTANQYLAAMESIITGAGLWNLAKGTNNLCIGGPWGR